MAIGCASTYRPYLSFNSLNTYLYNLVKVEIILMEVWTFLREISGKTREFGLQKVMGSLNSLHIHNRSGVVILAFICTNGHFPFGHTQEFLDPLNLKFVCSRHGSVVNMESLVT